MSNTTRILGIEGSDGEACECCGAICTKKRVVLDFDGDHRRYGISCAIQAAMPNRTDVTRTRKEQLINAAVKESAKIKWTHDRYAAKLEAVRDWDVNVELYTWKLLCPAAKEGIV